MTTPTMHPDQLHTDAALVRSLLTAQLTQLSLLPITPLASTGTENAIYRLGDDLALRLPLRPGKAEQLRKIHRWLPQLAPHLPLPTPEPIAFGAPSPDYPSPWSVCRWLPGEALSERALPGVVETVEVAEELAHFIRALWRLDPTGGPPPGAHNFQRGAPLADRDAQTRDAIAQAAHLIDARAATDAWEADLGADPWPHDPVWVHGDLQPGNLLASEGRLCGVIDWGGLGVGDPATDLLPAWNLFEGSSRDAFRDALEIDAATWARGRGLALSVGLVALPYYQDTNPAMARWARHMIDAALADHANTSG